MKYTKPAEIVTRQFTLRPLRKSDAPAILKNINDRIIFRNLLTVAYPYTPKNVLRDLNHVHNLARRKNTTDIPFAIEIDGECAGIISICNIEEHRGEVSYWIGRQYRDKGIMTKAVNEITKFGFSQLNLNRVCAHVFPFNKASMRVLEKAGYKFEGILRKNVMKNGKLLYQNLFAKVR